MEGFPSIPQDTVLRVEPAYNQPNAVPDGNGRWVAVGMEEDTPRSIVEVHDHRGQVAQQRCAQRKF